jgi:PAS domain S-box-containing protein
MTPNGSSPAFPFVADVAFQAGDIVFATDRFGCVVYWNREAEAISGYKAEEALGKPYTLACRMEPEVATLDLLAILAGRDFAGAVRCRSRGGGEVALYLFATAGRNPAGKPAGVVFVGRDVTGLWQAEEAAQASADKYRVLFENTLDAAAIADMDGKVLEANPACLRLYGYTVEEVKGRKLTDAVAPEDRGAAAAAMANLAAGRLVTKTIKVRRKDGTRFVVDLVASVMVVGGERRIMAVTRDVTERVRAEQARSQSERMYRAVFESANDAVFIESVDGRILDVNRNGCELLGYTKDELTRRSVSDLVPAEARAWLPRVVDAILREKTFRTEAVNVHKSGRHIPVEISASTMELDGKTVVLAIVRDVSERKRAERVLRESEEKSRSVSEQSPNMIFINSGGRVVYANQKSTAVMGYTREEFYSPGFDFMRLIAAESAEKIKTVYARHARGEEVESFEYTLVTKAGRRIESIITTKLIEYEGTKAILGIVTDITERKAGEQALRESQERYRRLLETSPDGVAVHQDGKVVLMNPAGAHLLGYDDPAELAGTSVVDFLHPDDKAEVLDRMRQVLASGRTGSPAQARFRRRDGSYVPLEVANATFSWQGRPAIQVVFRDVSEREAAELALRQSEEKYRSVVERASDGICVVQEGRLKYVNRALAEMAGYTAEELVGGRFVEYLHPDDRAAVADRYRRRLRGEKLPSAYTVRFLRRDGGTVLVEVNAALSAYEGASADIVLVRDVTERERLARVAEETADELRAVLDNSPGAIAGECEGMLVYANQRFARLFGYESPADVIGRPAGDFDAPQDRELLAEYSQRREQGQDAPTSYSFRGLKRDGTIVPMEASISTYRSLGRLHILAIIRAAEPGRGGC